MGRTELVVGNWWWVPAGCSVYTEDMAAHYNERASDDPRSLKDDRFTKVMHPDCEPTHNEPGECATDASKCPDGNSHSCKQFCVANGMNTSRNVDINSWSNIPFGCVYDNAQRCWLNTNRGSTAPLNTNHVKAANRSSSFRVFKTPSGYVVGDSAEDHDVVTPSSYVIKKTGTPAVNVTKEGAERSWSTTATGTRIAVLQEADEGQSSTRLLQFWVSERLLCVASLFTKKRTRKVRGDVVLQQCRHGQEVRLQSKHSWLRRKIVNEQIGQAFFFSF